MFGKHFKIVEQIAVVFVFAVIVPMSISGFIINNINQQSMRYQLRESAVLIANMVSDEIDFFNKTVSSNLDQVVFSLNYFKTPAAKTAAVPFPCCLILGLSASVSKGIITNVIL